MSARSVLIVDDNHATQRLFGLIVVAAGMRPVEVSSGVEALDRLQTERFDLVLLDLMMPDTTGFEVLDRMSREGGLPSVPVIVVTARDVRTVRVEALRRGAADVVIKPVDRVELVVRMNRAMAAHEAWGIDRERRAAAEAALGVLGEMVGAQVYNVDADGRIRHAVGGSGGTTLADELPADAAAVVEALRCAAPCDRPDRATVRLADGRERAAMVQALADGTWCVVLVPASAAHAD